MVTVSEEKCVWLGQRLGRLTEGLLAHWNVQGTTVSLQLNTPPPPPPPPPSLHGSPCAIASVLVLVKRADTLGVVKGGAGSVQVMEVNRLASSKLKMARVKLGIPGGAMWSYIRVIPPTASLLAQYTHASKAWHVWLVHAGCTAHKVHNMWSYIMWVCTTKGGLTCDS